MALTTLIIHCSGNRRSITTLLSACTTHKVCWSFSLIFLVRIPFSVAYFGPFLSFFSSFYFFSPHAHTLFFLELGTKRRSSPLPFISMHLSIFQMLFFHEQSNSLWKTFVSFIQSIHSILILIFFFSLLALVLFWTCVCVCVFCQTHPFLSLLSAHFLVKPFISETGAPLKVSEAKLAFATKAALIWNGLQKCGRQCAGLHRE